MVVIIWKKNSLNIFLFNSAIMIIVFCVVSVKINIVLLSEGSSL